MGLMTFAITNHCREPLFCQEPFQPAGTNSPKVQLHKRNYTTIYRIRIWNMATGELVHALYPFEQDTCEDVVGLQWTADSQYILAATKTDLASTGDEHSINIWNARSGRHRVNLIDGLSPAWGVVIVPDGSRVAAGGTVYAGGTDTRVIRFWDLAAALKQIRTFEDSLAGRTAGK